MALTMTATAGGVPAGNYRMELTGVEDFKPEEDKGYGPAVKFTYKVIGGKENGAEPSRIYSAKLSPKAGLTKHVVALLGRAIAPGENIDLEQFVGTVGFGIVEETDSGATRVATFVPDAVA